MALWTLEEINSALGLQLDCFNILIQSITIDCRFVTLNSLFFGIKGQNFNGSKFAVQALKRGSVMAIVDHFPTQDKQLQKQMVIVKDVYQSMVQLSKYSRQRFKGKIIAITGSNGKTSTKQMFGKALSNYKTFITPGNKNNLIGVPFTLCQIPRDYDFAVIQLGMSHEGQIRELVNLVRPFISIVTNVSEAHLENFKNIRGIASAKSQIFENVQENGYAIYNGDGQQQQILADKAKKHKLNIIRFGQNEENDVKLVSIQKSEEKGQISLIRAWYEGRQYYYKMNLLGKHLIINSLAVICGLIALGLQISIGLENIQEFLPLPGRGQIQMLANQITLLDESYNANKASVQASIVNLTNYRNCRLIIILGDMKELGEESKKIHASLVDVIIRQKVDVVHLVGKDMRSLYQVLPANVRGVMAENSKQANQKIVKTLNKGDSILVKGSNSMNMKYIVDELKQRLNTQISEPFV